MNYKNFVSYNELKKLFYTVGLPVALDFIY